MLDKQSQFVLNHLISIADENNVISDCSQIYQFMPRYTEHQIEDSIGYMHDVGYIKAYYADGGPFLININYSGLHYKDFDKIKFKNFLMESIFTPIIVSAITTLLALCLNGFFTTGI